MARPCYGEAGFSLIKPLKRTDRIGGRHARRRVASQLAHGVAADRGSSSVWPANPPCRCDYGSWSTTALLGLRHRCSPATIGGGDTWSA
jgi:hypothetical protein